MLDMTWPGDIRVEEWGKKIPNLQTVGFAGFIMDVVC